MVRRSSFRCGSGRLSSVFAVVILGFSNRSAQISPTAPVEVTGGQIAGVVEDGIASYMGIPFAAPPVGPLRWKAPQPVTPWTGVRKADEFGPAPMQAEIAKWLVGAKTLSEDCLYLNVWTPVTSPRERLPVMVWIYGGAYKFGATSTSVYDGTRLAGKGVVVVSVAYRLGPFGFLAHPELSAESGKGSGCYGLMDQIAALRWVKSNIAPFGGDPSCVTIFGESAGAMSISTLMCAPDAVGLFQRAICESGVMMAPVKDGVDVMRSTPSQRLAERQGIEFLKKLGVQDINAARALSADQIQKASGEFSPDAPVDGQTVLGDQYELFEAGRFANVPLLAGWNTDDGGMFAPSTVPSAGIVRTMFGPSADAILAVYPHATDLQARQSARELIRDAFFVWPATARAKMIARSGKSKAFLYHFDYRVGREPDGPSHGAEIEYVFGNLGGWFKSPSQADRAISDTMMSYWVNFAKTGNPNGAGLPNWPSFDEGTTQVQYLGRTVEAEPLPGPDKIKALDDYYARLRRERKAELKR